MNVGGNVCARVAGGELETAAKTVTVPISPTEVEAMFFGFDDQSQVHEVGPSTESEVHITSVKCTCASQQYRHHQRSAFAVSLEDPPMFSVSELFRSVEDCCCFVGISANRFCYWEWSRFKVKVKRNVA